MDDPPPAKHTLHLLYHSFRPTTHRSASDSLTNANGSSSIGGDQSNAVNGDDIANATSTTNATTTASTNASSSSASSQNVNNNTGSNHYENNNENETFEQSLTDIAEQIISSGFAQPALFDSLIVESAVVSNEYLALLLDDGRVCRIAYNILNQNANSGASSVSADTGVNTTKTPSVTPSLVAMNAAAASGTSSSKSSSVVLLQSNISRCDGFWF
jgi:hypothetical protein